jgi:hypothetical protein
MKLAESQFTSLREKYIQQISEKRAEIKTLEDKLSLLGEIEEEVQNEANSDQQMRLPVIQSDRYATMGLTEATLDAVTRLSRQSPKVAIRRRSVARYLRENGYKPKGKNFLISVDTVLRRLADKEKITTTIEEGKRFYFPKEDGG